MKALLFHSKRLCMALLIVLWAVLMGCAPTSEEPSEASSIWEDEPDGSAVVFPMYSAAQEVREETFTNVYETAHAAAFVSAHAVSEDRAREVLDGFEALILPMLPLPSVLEEQKLNVLFSHMEGKVYGYTPFPLSEQGPIVCLNALYLEDLEYALAHEYQHLCAFDACKAGNTVLSEETDELLSDVFCERLFPGRGRERGILSEERQKAVRDTMAAWGQDGLPYAHTLLREGYGEEKLLSALENR